ncbi:hypothetical protein [Aeromonas caviae]|uniref:Uncharacterized protein n=7 Tax=Aeromonas TaxID=642 RepID=A0AAF0GDJ6_AERCA|nr:hypothetical protein [Aeromonas caviae]WGC86188.1 hypothetical protein OJY61_23220 [Aeromonas caviae]
MIQETINRLTTMVEEGSRDALPAFSGTLIRRDSLRRLTGGAMMAVGRPGGIR